MPIPTSLTNHAASVPLPNNSIEKISQQHLPQDGTLPRQLDESLQLGFNFTIGDLHGNTLNLVRILHMTKTITLTDEQYRQLTESYNAIRDIMKLRYNPSKQVCKIINFISLEQAQALTKHINIFKEFVSFGVDLARGNGSSSREGKITFLGDEIADRNGIDGIFRAIQSAFIEKKINHIVIASNHGLTGLLSFLPDKAGKNIIEKDQVQLVGTNVSKTIHEYFCHFHMNHLPLLQSLSYLRDAVHLQTLKNNGDKAPLELTKEHYMGAYIDNLNLISAQKHQKRDINGQSLVVISTHAPINYKIICDLASLLLEKQQIDFIQFKNDISYFFKIINQINKIFRVKLRTPGAYEWLNEQINNNTELRNFCVVPKPLVNRTALSNIIWVRKSELITCEQSHEAYRAHFAFKVIFRHGHDDPTNLYNIDGYNGFDNEYGKMDELRYAIKRDSSRETLDHNPFPLCSSFDSECSDDIEHHVAHHTDPTAPGSLVKTTMGSVIIPL